MINSIALFFCEKSGLILNLIGTLLIAFSLSKNLGGAYQKDEKGRKIYLASFVSPTMFKIGIGLVMLGFLLQIIAG